MRSAAHLVRLGWWWLPALFAMSDPAAAATAAPPVAILRVTVIDATGAAPRPNQAVVLENGRILALGPAGEVALPRGARVVDGAHGFLIPGLWDMHVHVLRRGRSLPYFPLLVAHGITGVRDMGGDYDFESLRRLRGEIEAGTRIGPQFVASGPFVDGPYPSLPALSRVVADEAQARAAVRTLQREGADFIKVYNRLPRAAYFAIADQARQLGIPFAGHVPFSVSAREAAEAGQRSIEHLFNVAFACSSREDEWMRVKAEALAADESTKRRRLRRAYLLGVLDSFSPTRCAALYRTFVHQRTWQVPTLAQRRAFSGLDSPAPSATDLAYVPRSQRVGWDPRQDGRLQGREDVDREIERRYWALDASLVAPMHAAGVRFLAGTDAGDPYALPGSSLHQELEALVAAGLSPMDALQAATRNAAEVLGRGDDFGTIEVGRRADLVLLSANPLEDIRNTRTIEAVALGGRWLDRRSLDALLEQARSAAEAQ